MANEESDRAARLERMTKMAQSLVNDTNTIADVLYEVIERITAGNPRLLKSERQDIARDLGEIIQVSAIIAKVVGDYSTLYNSSVSIQNNDERIYRAHMEIFRQLREMILNGEKTPAIELIDNLLKGPH